MTREQKIAKAKELRQAGKSYEQIATSLGMSKGGVRGLLNRRWPLPARICYVCGSTFTPQHGNQKVCCGENARKRWHDDHTRGRCEDCGGELSAGSGYESRSHRRCQSCWRARETERIEARGRKIERWWAEGLTLNQIAAALDWSTKSLGVEMHRLRAQGFNLPYRWPRKNAPRFPEQVPT